jgi:hypothetical protein
LHARVDTAWRFASRAFTILGEFYQE